MNSSSNILPFSKTFHSNNLNVNINEKINLTEKEVTSLVSKLLKEASHTHMIEKKLTDSELAALMERIKPANIVVGKLSSFIQIDPKTQLNNPQTVGNSLAFIEIEMPGKICVPTPQQIIHQMPGNLRNTSQDLYYVLNKYKKTIVISKKKYEIYLVRFFKNLNLLALRANSLSDQDLSKRIKEQPDNSGRKSATIKANDIDCLLKKDAIEAHHTADKCGSTVPDFKKQFLEMHNEFLKENRVLKKNFEVINKELNQKETIGVSMEPNLKGTKINVIMSIEKHSLYDQFNRTFILPYGGMFPFLEIPNLYSFKVLGSLIYKKDAYIIQK